MSAEAMLQEELASQGNLEMSEAATSVEVAVEVAAEAEASESTATVTVRSLPGRVLAVVKPVPSMVAALKAEIELQTGCAEVLQKLLVAGGTRVLADDEKLAEIESHDVIMVVDESPLAEWDYGKNPDHKQLEIQGGTVKCPKLRSDYVNVLTREPMRSGRHYFQFIMHTIGDEQWCGVVSNPEQAGARYSGRRLTAWTYYCGRMNSRGTSIVDGAGALHAEGKAVKQFKTLQKSGDVIGMLVDIDEGAIAFELNGELQGACPIPKATPLWVLTHVDTASDHVELVKLALGDAPISSIESLSGALLDVTKGQ
eukprot:CAMPEP_0172671750 /NCGR_PEP_ID=MMETSP1074-20121228/11116_1 /TAXON_ID=2916 /ORGANISM="Ceratium fusus, Strain PA161109" /LENGTH=311 /DNA_ID=CAMNT_0013488849 /DNA_START=27 /DNA_END=959 /DNA_ORIENTATION=+